MIHFLLGSLYTFSCHTLGVWSFSNRLTIMGKATSNTYIHIRGTFRYFTVFFISTCNFLSFSTGSHPMRLLLTQVSITEVLNKLSNFHSGNALYFVGLFQVPNIVYLAKLTVCANLEAMLVRSSSIFNNKAHNFTYLLVWRPQTLPRPASGA